MSACVYQFIISILLTRSLNVNLVLTVLNVRPQSSLCLLFLLISLLFDLHCHFFFHDIWVVSLKYIKRYCKTLSYCREWGHISKFFIDYLF